MSGDHHSVNGSFGGEWTPGATLNFGSAFLVTLPDGSRVTIPARSTAVEIPVDGGETLAPSTGQVAGQRSSTAPPSREDIIDSTILARLMTGPKPWGFVCMIVDTALKTAGLPPASDEDFEAGLTRLATKRLATITHHAPMLSMFVADGPFAAPGVSTTLAERLAVYERHPCSREGCAHGRVVHGYDGCNFCGCCLYVAPSEGPGPALPSPSPGSAVGDGTSVPTDAELAWELRKVQDLIDDHGHGREVVILPAALGAMKLLVAELKRLRPALNVNPDAASGAVP